MTLKGFNFDHYPAHPRGGFLSSMYLCPYLIILEDRIMKMQGMTHLPFYDNAMCCTQENAAKMLVRISRSNYSSLGLLNFGQLKLRDKKCIF